MIELFKQIGELIANKNAGQFKILGYKHLEVIVKLIYHDCNEYYIADYDSEKADGSFKSLKRIGFGPDRDSLEETRSWVKEYGELEEETENIEGKSSIRFDENWRENLGKK